MMPTYDDSTPKRRAANYKPFHHLYSPDGKTLLAKGPGGLYPHHRGIFYGFSRIRYGDGKSCDTWHCKGKAYLSADGVNWVKGIKKGDSKKGTLNDGASHCVLIGWYGEEGELFAQEYRILAMRRAEYFSVEGWKLDFSLLLESADGGTIQLDGDPQHAGFQFRAAQEVAAKTADQTYYLRTDGKGEPGDYRNWDHKNRDASQNAECENRPWNAMSFVVEDQRYTVLYLNHPDNPKPARYSERDYGRFGSYFVSEVTKESPLVVNYRLWVQPGEMTVDQCREIHQAYVPELEKQQREDPFGP